MARRAIAREISDMLDLEYEIISEIKNLLNNKLLNHIKELINKARRYKLDIDDGYGDFESWIHDVSFEVNYIKDIRGSDLNDLLDELNYYSPEIEIFMKYCGLKNHKLDIDRLERVLKVLDD